MQIVGIDASISNTGIIIIDENCLLIRQENIKTDKNCSRIGKLSIFCHIFKIFIRNTIKNNIDTIFGIEDYAFGVRNSRSLISLGEQGGLIRLFFHNNKLKYFTYSPSIVKKFTTGKGNAQKDIMLKEVFRKWKFNTNDSNLSDAYAVARLCLAEYQIKNNIKQIKDFLAYEQEVLKNIIK